MSLVAGGAEDILEDMASRGLRVLAVAARQASDIGDDTPVGARDRRKGSAGRRAGPRRVTRPRRRRARPVAPEDKLRIATALQARGHFVAREATDLVLLDDDFATIVAALQQGRATFTNVHRFLTYHLTDNVAELTPFVVWGLSGGRFPLTLGVIQILCLDIGTDLLPALEALVEMSAFLVARTAAGWRPGEAFPSGVALLAALAGFLLIPPVASILDHAPPPAADRRPRRGSPCRTRGARRRRAPQEGAGSAPPTSVVTG